MNTLNTAVKIAVSTTEAPVYNNTRLVTFHVNDEFHSIIEGIECVNKWIGDWSNQDSIFYSDDNGETFSSVWDHGAGFMKYMAGEFCLEIDGAVYVLHVTEQGFLEAKSVKLSIIVDHTKGESYDSFYNSDRKHCVPSVAGCPIITEHTSSFDTRYSCDNDLFLNDLYGCYEKDTRVHNRFAILKESFEEKCEEWAKTVPHVFFLENVCVEDDGDGNQEWDWSSFIPTLEKNEGYQVNYYMMASTIGGDRYFAGSLMNKPFTMPGSEQIWTLTWNDNQQGDYALAVYQDHEEEYSEYESLFDDKRGNFWAK